MMKNIFFFALLCLIMSFSSCQNEIDFNFKSAVPNLVVEGIITNKDAKVYLSKTHDMGDTIRTSVFKDAIVDITGSDGTNESLVYNNDGTFRPVSVLKGCKGVSYTLHVAAEGKDYTSTSIMQDTTSIIHTEFEWKKILNEDWLYYKFELHDIPNVDNWYCYKMYKNGEIYKWGIFDDTGYKNSIIEEKILCMSRSVYNDNKKDDQDKIIHDQDSIRLDLMAIDHNTYNYLYSLELNSTNNANPLPNFQGGCLGYFSACSITSVKDKFVYLP